VRAYSAARSTFSEAPLPLAVADTGGVRLTEFWDRMRDHFGMAYADSFARDHVISTLGGRTVHEALRAGVDAKDVWRAVCEVAEVPKSKW
jgi:Protein of unknown function (DUF3046)